jgi:hypothetical protein
VPSILRNIPYFDAETHVSVNDQEIPIRGSQIVVWLSITEVGQKDVAPGIRRFPAILDTGLSHNFSIQEEQLIEWAGLDPSHLPIIGAVRLVGKRTADGEEQPLLARRNAAAWLHRNRPGERDSLLEATTLH